MVGVSCLVKDTALLQDIKDLVEYIGYTNIAEGRDASIASVYNTIRKSGIEIDLQSVGHIYNEALPKQYGQFNSDLEVNDFILKTYADAVRRAALLEPKVGEEQIGQEKPELYLVEGLLNMFTNTHAEDQSTKSAMVQMQTAMWKGIQRKLGLKDNQQPKTKDQWRDILTRSLDYEKLGITDLNGKLNNINDLYNAMQAQLEDASKQLIAKGDFAEVEKWFDMVDQLRASTYSLLFSKGEAKAVLEGIFKNSGYGKTLNNGQTVIDWNKLAGGFGSIQDLRENVQSVMEKAGYNQEVIENLKNSLENEFNELHAKNIEKQLTDTKRIASQGAKDIIGDAVTRFLNGKTMQDWIKDGKVETMEQLEEHAMVELQDKKYQPAVRSEIIKRLKDFFNRNYARVEGKEAQDAIEELGIQAPGLAKKKTPTVKVESDKPTVLQWIKSNGLHNKKELFDAIDAGLAGRVISPAIVDNIKREFNRILDLENKAETDLKNREERIGESVPKKSDIRRLVELNNLGVFESSHDKVLYNLIGVPELQQQDLEDLKQIASAASDLFRRIDKDYGSDIFASRHLQTLQRAIDGIIARNINNKSFLMKVIGVIKGFFDVLLTGLLMRPFTLLENIISGTKEIMVPALFGSGLKKEDVEIYRKMLSDVALRGQSFGEEIGSFAPRELYTNMLKWKWKGGSIKEKAESLLYAIMLPGRIGLLGFDSANKVTITNKTFNNAIYKALTQQGMSKDAATQFMNEALYGKSFDDAKKDAEELINTINRKLPVKYKVPVNSRTITTFANDLVKHNLNADGALSNEVVEGAYKSSYHVAGYGLGHEPNNIISSQIKGYRDRRRKAEQELAKDKNWKRLARHRMLDTFTNGMIIRFTGGATNWAVLRVQSGLGLGLATGFMGQWNRDIDFSDEKSIQESIKQREGRRNMIGRALIGMSYTIIGYGVGYGLWEAYGGGDDEEMKKRLVQAKKERETVAKTKAASGEADAKSKKISDLDLEIKRLNEGVNFNQHIKGNWMLSRFFRKTAPDAMLLSYYLDTNKSNMLGAMRYIQNTTGLGSESTISSQFIEAINQANNGDKQAASGILGNVLGSRMGVPIWSAGKDWMKLAQWIGGGNPSSDWKKPTEFSEGLWGGGAMEDLGMYKRDPKITNLPGIGGKTYDIYKEHGIETMDDLKNTKEWWNMKHKDEEGHERYIIRTAADRLKAQEAFKKYQEQNQ